MPTYLPSISERNSQTLWVSDLTKSNYQDDQKVKLQCLQAEVECLLQQLQHLKQQKEAVPEQED